MQLGDTEYEIEATPAEDPVPRREPEPEPEREREPTTAPEQVPA